VSLFMVSHREDLERVLEIMGHDTIILSRAFDGFVVIAEQGPVDTVQLGQDVQRDTNFAQWSRGSMLEVLG